MFAFCFSYPRRTVVFALNACALNCTFQVHRQTNRNFRSHGEVLNGKRRVFWRTPETLKIVVDRNNDIFSLVTQPDRSHRFHDCSVVTFGIAIFRRVDCT